MSREHDIDRIMEIIIISADEDDDDYDDDVTSESTVTCDDNDVIKGIGLIVSESV
jgi:hypothetical protein